MQTLAHKRWEKAALDARMANMSGVYFFGNDVDEMWDAITQTNEQVFQLLCENRMLKEKLKDLEGARDESL